MVAASTGMVNIQEAADYLKLSVSMLRSAVARSRNRLCGEIVTGPTIRFFQTTPRAPIWFRPEWLDEFVANGTVDCSTAPPPVAKATVPSSKSKPVSGHFLDPSLWR